MGVESVSIASASEAAAILTLRVLIFPDSFLVGFHRSAVHDLAIIRTPELQDPGAARADAEPVVAAADAAADPNPVDEQGRRAAAGGHRAGDDLADVDGGRPPRTRAGWFLSFAA